MRMLVLISILYDIILDDFFIRSQRNIIDL